MFNIQQQYKHDEILEKKIDHFWNKFRTFKVCMMYMFCSMQFKFLELTIKTANLT